jgi:glutathione S-transferase
MAGAYSEYGINRYMSETRRLFDVLESRLKDADWLAGNKYTIADIASYSWVRAAPTFLDFKLSDWPGVEKWVERIAERPAVQKAQKIPEGTRSSEEMAQMAKGMREKVDAMKETKRDS